MKCRGCGVTLQYTDKQKPGYTPKEGSIYCQRCFRLIHYDDLTISMKQGIDPDTVMEAVERMDAAVLYVCDLFDFESGMIPGLQRKIGEKDIILACTKRDLLPETVSHEKIARFVFGRLKEYGIRIKELILVSGYTKEGIAELKEAVQKHASGKQVVVMGRANSGKSTLLNALAGESVLTSSRYPGTTLDFNEFTIDGITYVDTPGIEIGKSILMSAAEQDLKTILPARTIKPKVYQIHEDQSFSIGGLARVDVCCGSAATVTWYLSDAVYLHRSKTADADSLWERQYGKLLVPIPQNAVFTTYIFKKNEDKNDVCIDGLGWCCISGDAGVVRVKAPSDVNVTFRKAML